MNNKNHSNDAYRVSGVNIDIGNKLVDKIKPLAESTKSPFLLDGIGGFGALYQVPKGYDDPVLVSGCDGVGTKLKLAIELAHHASIGVDLVAMSVNDILTQGAKPLFFHDYFSCGKLELNIAKSVISGIVKGCKIAECSLIGGETAEMPGMYTGKDYDLAGFAVGIVEKSKIIDGKSIKERDLVIGLGSSGIHSNGYSLVHKILKDTSTSLNTGFKQHSLGMELLSPTRIYVKSILSLSERVNIKGIAHITGGGIIGNLPRILPQDLGAQIFISNWEMPDIFIWLSQAGNLSITSMLEVFNCGIGMILIIAEEDSKQALDSLRNSGEKAFVLGDIIRRQEKRSILIQD